MMRGPAYDDSYLSRRMGSMAIAPPLSYGRTPSYLQLLDMQNQNEYDHAMHRRSIVHSSDTDYFFNPFKDEDDMAEYGMMVPRTPSYLDYRDNRDYVASYRFDTRPNYRIYWPSRGTTREVWNLPTARSRYNFLKNWDVTCHEKPYLGYLPPARLPPRGPPPPSCYDYDYGYGGGYYGAPAPAPYYGGGGGGYYPPYGGGYAPPAPRYSRFDHFLDDDYEVSYPHLRNTRQSEVEKEKTEQQREEGGAPRKSRLRAIEASPSSSQTTPVITEGDRHLARMQLRYPTLSEPQMLQDQVDKMRIRLKALAYSLDPSGPVPEIVVPPRSKKASEDIDYSKKYTSAVEMSELPRLSTRRHHYYPEDEHMKDNLGIKCLSHYKNTRTQAEYYKPKHYVPTEALPDYTSKYSSRSLAKWEEPDTVYGPSSDKKPYSKADAGDEDDSKKEKRKKKKSRERDELSATDISAVTADPSAAPEAAAAEPAGDGELGEDGELDEKEKKRLEKKKRKAEREAAAKAAMEAELAALAEAEAELARLEAEAPAEVKAEEAAAEK